MIRCLRQCACYNSFFIGVWTRRKNINPENRPGDLTNTRKLKASHLMRRRRIVCVMTLHSLCKRQSIEGEPEESSKFLFTQDCFDSVFVEAWKDLYYDGIPRWPTRSLSLLFVIVSRGTCYSSKLWLFDTGFFADVYNKSNRDAIFPLYIEAYAILRYMRKKHEGRESTALEIKKETIPRKYFSQNF